MQRVKREVAQVLFKTIGITQANCILYWGDGRGAARRVSTQSKAWQNPGSFREAEGRRGKVPHGPQHGAPAKYSSQKLSNPPACLWTSRTPAPTHEFLLRTPSFPAKNVRSLLDFSNRKGTIFDRENSCPSVILVKRLLQAEKVFDKEGVGRADAPSSLPSVKVPYQRGSVLVPAARAEAATPGHTAQPQLNTILLLQSGGFVPVESVSAPPSTEALDVTVPLSIKADAFDQEFFSRSGSIAALESVSSSSVTAVTGEA